MNTFSETSSRGLTSEDVVIIVVCAIGFIGSVIIYALKMPPIIVSVFLATGVASLVYRFLGGIYGVSFVMGALKLTGTAAFLIGSAWFINSYLAKQTINDGNGFFSPHGDSWFAVGKGDGIPVQVRIKGRNVTIDKPPFDILLHNQLNIRQQDNKFVIVSEKEPQFMFGNVHTEDFQAVNFYNSIGRKIDNFIVTHRLPPHSSDIDLDPIPLTLSTRDYGGEYSRYILSDEEENVVYVGAIYRRQAEIVKLQDTYYLIAVTEVNHNPQEGEELYAKFAVGKIVVQIEP